MTMKAVEPYNLIYNTTVEPHITTQLRFVIKSGTILYQLLFAVHNSVYYEYIRPEKWAKGFILRHGNALCHTSLLVRKFLSNKNITVCPHPPYSPDLAP